MSSRVAAALAASLGLSACQDGFMAPGRDPAPAARPGHDAVDGRLDGMIAGTRHRALYAREDAFAGAAEPLVTIVVWSDFQCPFCGQFAAVLDELVRAYPDDVRVVFKHFPLAMHPRAEQAAAAAIAAQAQGRFWAMHDRLFARRAFGADDLRAHAEALGLDLERFAADLDANATAAQIAADQAQARALQVRGTPSFFVNGLRFRGMVEPAELIKLIDGERELARAMIDAGSERIEIYARFMRVAHPAVPAPS